MVCRHEFIGSNRCALCGWEAPRVWISTGPGHIAQFALQPVSVAGKIEHLVIPEPQSEQEAFERSIGDGALAPAQGAPHPRFPWHEGYRAIPRKPGGRWFPPQPVGAASDVPPGPGGTPEGAVREAPGGAGAEGTSGAPVRTEYGQPLTLLALLWRLITPEEGFGDSRGARARR